MARALTNERWAGRGALLVASLLITLATAVGPATALGATTGGPGVVVQVHPTSGSPSTYFDAHVGSGRSVIGSLAVVNTGSRSISVRLDPVDALTTNTLGSAYALTASARGPSSWIHLGHRRLTIPARAARSVGVSVQVPASARPGDYLSGIGVEALAATRVTSVAGGMSIGEIDRYAIGVELKLPGPRFPAIRFTGARVVRYPSRLTFLLLARNSGNVILQNVQGEATVSRDGRVLASVPLGPGTFVTGTAIAYPIGVPGEEPSEGTRYQVEADLRYGGGVAHLDTSVVFGRAAASVQQRYLVATPASGGGNDTAVLAGGALVLLLAGGGFALLLRRRRSLHGAAARAYLERTLATASETHPVSLMRIEIAGPGGGRRVARVVGQRIRATDRLCDLAGRLVLLLPGTGAQTAAGLAVDLGAALAREGVLTTSGAVPVATATTPVGVEELIAACRAPVAVAA